MTMQKTAEARALRAGDLAGLPTDDERLAEAFPNVNPDVTPLGSRILVQLRKPKTHSRGGLILADASIDAEKWNTQVAKVIAVGPVAFKSRATLDEWPEKAWCQPGDFVRVPKYNGDRFEVEYTLANSTEKHKALFVLFNDLELLAKVEGDPLRMIAFVA